MRSCRLSPSVYTDVSKISSWIRSYTEDSDKQPRTTLQPTPSVAIVQSSKQSCQSLTGYYTGVFKNTENPNRFYPAQFEIKVTADMTSKRYQIATTNWNHSVSNSNDFHVSFMTSSSIKQ